MDSLKSVFNVFCPGRKSPLGVPDSGAIFEAYLNNSLRFSEVNFSHFTSQVTLFFVENGSLKFLIHKCDEERNQKMFHFRRVRQIASKIF